MSDREDFERLFSESRINEHGCSEQRAKQMLERDDERYNNAYVEGYWQGFQLARSVRPTLGVEIPDEVTKSDAPAFLWDESDRHHWALGYNECRDDVRDAVPQQSVSDEVFEARVTRASKENPDLPEDFIRDSLKAKGEPVKPYVRGGKPND